MLFVTDVSHFASSETFIQMIPPAPLPAIFELPLASALLSRAYYRFAGSAVAVFLLLIWPANVYNAMVGNEVPGGFERFIPNYLWVRLLFQPLYIWWAVWCARDPH